MRIASLFLLLFALIVSGCASGPPKRVFPPELSLQELRTDSSGQWTATLRVRSFSTVTMLVTDIDGQLTLGEGAMLPITLTPQRDVAAGSVELLDMVFTASDELRAQVEGLQRSRGVLKYRLNGELRSNEPRGRFDFDYSSALSPVPGLDGIWR